jgi:hypothetical protein
MARPRTVKPEDSLHQLDGAPKPATGYLARRAKAALRADESRRLSREEAADAMRFTEEQLRVLDAIAAGLPVRGAREVIAAMRLKAEFLMPKPAGAIDHRVGVLLVQDPYACDASIEPTPLPPIAAVTIDALPEGQPPETDDEHDDDEES